MTLQQLSTGTFGSDHAGSARAGLREATAQDHAAVDKAYSAFDLSEPGSYRDFLHAQRACIARLEDALTAAGAERLLPDWPSRRRTQLLAADLSELGPVEDPDPFPHALPDLRDPAAVMGAIYVLEGSRFGGAVLARRIEAGMPARFLGARAEPRAWRVLMSALDRHLSSERALAVAVSSARTVFGAFAAAARLRLEPALA